MPQSSPLSVAVFDLDYTLLNTNISYAFGKFLFHQRIIPRTALLISLFFYLLHRYGLLSIEKAHQRIFSLCFRSIKASYLTALANEFVKKNLSHYLNTSILQHLRQAQQNGQYTILLSSSPSFLVKPIAYLLSIKEFAGTSYHSDPSTDSFSFVERIISGPTKRQIVETTIHRLKVTWEEVAAYTDSILDLPLLDAAGTQYLVNPDHLLEKIGRKKGWKIIK
jgi:HAD superfamily hydrolase (TIGR01490 family)